MRPTPYPIEMQTANGDVTAHHELAVVIDRLDMDIHAIVMDDAPTVLSLGKRCMEDGYEFHWKLYQAPVLIAPSGRRESLELENFVPVLPVTAKCLVGASSSPTDVPLPPVASGGSSAPAEGDLKLECTPCRPELDPNSPIHKLLHSPKLSNCDICNEAKMQRARCPNRKHSRAARESRGRPRADDSSGDDDESAEETRPPAVKFCDLCTADHIILQDIQDMSVDGDSAALVIQDQASQWIECHPSATKSGENTLQAFKQFRKADKDVKRFLF